MNQQRGLIKYESRGEEVTLSVDIVRNFLVTGKKELVTDQEIYYFLGICRARHLNPFVKDCYLIKYGSEPAAIIVAIDFYRSRARSAPDCVGWQAGVICQNNETGTLRYSKGLVLDNETLVGGWFKARPRGWDVDFELEVNLGGYIKKTASGEITKFWSKPNQPSQIKKVAESQGLRTVWPDLFQGTITSEEAGLQMETIETVDITALKPEVEEPEPEPDTSEFDKLVAHKLAEAQPLARKVEIEKKLKDFIEVTAKSKSKKDRKVTAGTVKVRAAANFAKFWSVFEEWEKKQAPPPEPEKEAPPTKESPEADTPPTTTNPDDMPFEPLKLYVWNMVLDKKIPLGELKEKVGISSIAEITEGNVGIIRFFAEDYGTKKEKK